MTEPEPKPDEPLHLPETNAKKVRELLHDINNSLEIILQSAYLIGTLELGENGAQWMKLLEQGVTQTVELNRELRAQILPVATD